MGWEGGGWGGRQVLLQLPAPGASVASVSLACKCVPWSVLGGASLPLVAVGSPLQGGGKLREGRISGGKFCRSEKWRNPPPPPPAKFSRCGTQGSS